jgi:hypothetical protein
VGRFKSQEYGEKKMKTKLAAFLAVFVIAISMVATLSFATEVVPVEPVDDETLMREFIGRMYDERTGGELPPICKITAQICIWVYKEGLCEPEELKYLVTLEMVCDEPVITVEKLTGCDDLSCGEPIDIVVDVVTDDETMVNDFIARLLENKRQEAPDCITRVQVEICVEIDFCDPCMPSMTEYWLIVAELVEEEFVVTVWKLDWHELIMNQIKINGLIGYCRGNELEIVYDGPGRYESGYEDVHFYSIYKVNDDPFIRDCQARLELIRVGANMYRVEIYHSGKNGDVSIELPYEHIITCDLPVYKEAIITDDLC